MCTDSRHFATISDSIVRLMPTLLTTADVARIHGVDERISFENYGGMIQYYTRVMREGEGVGPVDRPEESLPILTCVSKSHCSRPHFPMLEADCS